MCHLVIEILNEECYYRNVDDTISLTIVVYLAMIIQAQKISITFKNLQNQNEYDQAVFQSSQV